jgi:hypothetical protein
MNLLKSKNFLIQCQAKHPKLTPEQEKRRQEKNLRFCEAYGGSARFVIHDAEPSIGGCCGNSEGYRPLVSSCCGAGRALGGLSLNSVERKMAKITNCDVRTHKPVLFRKHKCEVLPAEIEEILKAHFKEVPDDAVANFLFDPCGEELISCELTWERDHVIEKAERQTTILNGDTYEVGDE